MRPSSATSVPIRPRARAAFSADRSGSCSRRKSGPIARSSPIRPSPSMASSLTRLLSIVERLDQGRHRCRGADLTQRPDDLNAGFLVSPADRPPVRPVSASRAGEAPEPVDGAPARPPRLARVARHGGHRLDDPLVADALQRGGSVPADLAVIVAEGRHETLNGGGPCRSCRGQTPPAASGSDRRSEGIQGAPVPRARRRRIRRSPTPRNCLTTLTRWRSPSRRLSSAASLPDAASTSAASANPVPALRPKYSGLFARFDFLSLQERVGDLGEEVGVRLGQRDRRRLDERRVVMPLPELEQPVDDSASSSCRRTSGRSARHRAARISMLREHVVAFIDDQAHQPAGVFHHAREQHAASPASRCSTAARARRRVRRRTWMSSPAEDRPRSDTPETSGAGRCSVGGRAHSADRCCG